MTACHLILPTTIKNVQKCLNVCQIGKPVARLRIQNQNISILEVAEGVLGAENICIKETVMSQILRSKLVTTKTPHKCWGCTKEYPAGTRMEFSVCVDMGKVFSSYYCPTCQNYIYKTQYFSQGDEVCFGELCQNYDYPEGEL
jgi:hypothetical protein